MGSVHLLVLLMLCIPSAAQAGTAPPPQRICKTGPDTYRIGSVDLDAARREIRCSGRVNMAEGGPIELLACLPHGKTHETVLTLDLVPMDLQLSLLLLGLSPGRNPAVHYRPGSPSAQRPPGDTVLLSVQWRTPGDDGAEPAVRTVPAESLLLNVQTGKPAAGVRWVFLGSRLAEGRFGADLDGSIITTFHDPLAILEIAEETANDDIYYNANADLCPPVGTPVVLIIRVPPAEDAPAQGPRDEPSRVPPVPEEKEEHHAQDVEGGG